MHRNRLTTKFIREKNVYDIFNAQNSIQEKKYACKPHFILKVILPSLSNKLSINVLKNDFSDQRRVLFWATISETT